MIKYRNLQNSDVKQMNELFNNEIASQGFFAPIELAEFETRYIGDPDFSFEGAFGAFDGDELIGYAIGLIRAQNASNPNAPGYLNLFVVKQSYQRQGIGSHLIELVEGFIKEKGRPSIQASFYLPLCYRWFIPGFPGHDHPCAPGIRVNSPEYFFLLHRSYAAIAFEDAFHLPLSSYEYSPAIKDIMERNAKDGLTIHFYQEGVDHGLEEFYQDIQAIDFEKCIRANLLLDKPNPFLVITNQDHEVKGWTGALWNEASGRGHFDGIIISESIRGRGLGKALFASLAYESKKNGAQFMTFYTGLNNHARYIYMGAGFKIVQTYALMRKVFK